MINLTDNGNSTVTIQQSAGGQYYLDVHGTFGSGSVAVQISHDSGTNFFPVTTAVGTDLAITGDYNAVLTVPGGSQVKFVLTGATSPDLDLVFKEI